MKSNIEELRKKYMDNPPEGMTSKDIRNMSEDELLDMDFFLNENDLFADEAGVTALAGHRAAILFNSYLMKLTDRDLFKILEKFMNINNNCFNLDVDAVITSYNQGTMILEAVQSLCNQTVLPKRIIIVDDGTTDTYSIEILNAIGNDSELSVPVKMVFQENKGVSAARNTGINQAQSSLVLILDGDDKLEAKFIENVGRLLYDNPQMVIASSWMRTFGVLDAIIRPTGGNIVSFLSHNCCPATHILRRKFYEQCGGYDESMRSGFEDWDFFLSMLETTPEALAGIVEKPLINYRTASASTNIKSMNKRLELMRYIIEKHNNSYRDNITNVLLDIEAISNSRLFGWENEIIHSIKNNQELSDSANDFIKNPSYGDGGMASAVRIVSINK